MEDERNVRKPMNQYNALKPVFRTSFEKIKIDSKMATE
jgi:hypothetical protein